MNAQGRLTQDGYSGIGKMILNVNRVSAPLVRPGDMLDILMEYMGVRDMSRANPLNPKMPLPVKLKIIRFLKGTHVRANTRNPNDILCASLPRKYPVSQLMPSLPALFRSTIKDVDKKSATTHFFESEFGRINVYDYFKKKHNITLRHPDMPVVALTKTAFFPLECLSVLPGRTFFKKLSAAQTSEMLKSRCKHSLLPFPRLDDSYSSLSVSASRHPSP